MSKLGTAPRSPDGRFLSILCNDPNCEGSLELDFKYGRPRWICNGLTHDTENGPLRACNRSFDALSPPDGAK